MSEIVYSNLRPGVVPAGVDPMTVARSPITKRLGTPEGRASAIAMLRRLDEEGDVEEQRQALALLESGLCEHPIQFRRWNVETWEQIEDNWE